MDLAQRQALVLAQRRAQARDNLPDIAAWMHRSVGLRRDLQRRGQYARPRHSDGLRIWNDVAGFDINLHLISYSNLSTYGQAFWVGLLNTLLIAVICIPLATLLGFVIGVARLSPNWLLSRFALVYTSIMRNIPLLLLLLFWYNAVLKSLPGPRQSISIGDVVFLNNRGLYLPMPIARERASWFVAGVVVAIALAFGFRVWAKRRQDRTGAQAPTALVAAALILGLPAVVTAMAGAPFSFDVARLSGFNLKGGLQIIPKWPRLWSDLSPSLPRSSRRSFAQASWRCRLARSRRPARSACIAARR